MGCISPSAQDAADATTKAKEAVEKLQNALESEMAATKEKFFAEIDSSLAAANINDARQIDFAMNIKTEYTSEFSLDKIAGVVISAIQAAIAAQDPLAKAPATSPAALDAYTDVVVAVAEAAKSSSESASSLSYSMSRLSPGLFAFLYASSVNITDEALFGTEAVTSTSIFYRFMQSIEDIKNEAAFGEALIDKENLLNMKTLQAGLTDRLAKGEITPEDWARLDGQYSGMIDTIRDRLKNNGFPTVSDTKRSSQNREIVTAALEKLSSMGAQFSAAVETSKARLANDYY